MTAGDSDLTRGLALRRWPPRELPETPWPVLLPYRHPALLGGRERELAELRQLLLLPVPILGLHAASGAGKSSLLAAGLVPALRAEGLAVAFDRHPGEPGFAGRLIGDLLAADGGRAFELSESDAGRDPGLFVRFLLAARRLADAPPILVLDQFEDVLRADRSARALAGTLLAASVRRRPGLAEPVCRWLLAYRQELHGDVAAWLHDALRDARALDLAGCRDLPHDLSGPERFHDWPLPPLGTPRPGTADRAAAAARIFQAAIEKPLALLSEDGERISPRGKGKPLYPWRFAPGGGERLARAFGEARAARPEAPLAPELQVVLASLLDRASRGAAGRTQVLHVPEDPAALIDRALEAHLRRALDAAFPPGSDGHSRIGRTRALLTLRELADRHGRRAGGLSKEALALAIGAQGREVLERLATAGTRLVVLERHGGDWIYALSHDRLAAAVVRLVDQEAFAGLGVDAELVRLRRFVALRSELFAAGETEPATEVPAAHFRRIEASAEALIWGRHRRWWAACRRRRRHDRQRRWVRGAAAAALTALVAFGAWFWADRRVARAAALERVASDEPEAAFAALARLTAAGADPRELLERLRRRESPLDVLERGAGGVDAEERGAAVLRVAELALPLVRARPLDPVLLACTVWALDAFAVTDPASKESALALRAAALEPLRRRRPPPPEPAPGDPSWADVPAGSARTAAGREVAVPAFRLMTHEVTNAEYRRLVPEHEGPPDLPARALTWYEAYTYAAWLGGRLPTEAEWRYAARAGCAHQYCRRDGSEARLSEVAWWALNATDPETRESVPRSVAQLEPNPWGLFDVYGNVWEMTADWYRQGSAGALPVTSSPVGYRLRLGGGVWDDAAKMVAGRGLTPSYRNPRFGLRVALSRRPAAAAR